MIVSAILPPWAICPIPKHIRTELERRKNYGIKNVNQMDQIGPRFTWMRCMSNAIVNGRQGFIFRGGDGFENNYGIGGKNQNLMGHDANGVGHIIENKDAKMKYRPNPGITSLEVSIQKSIYRKCDIKWKCYSVDQLEYMGRYFFGLYNTVVLEWGWNNFNKDSLLPIFLIGNKPELDENKKLVEGKYGTGIKGVFYDPRVIENSILSSKGNYDAMIGHIVKWDYSFDQSDLSFNCTTEIASNSNIYLGLSLINLTENAAEAADEKSTVNEYFKSKFTAELKESISYKPDLVVGRAYGYAGPAITDRGFKNTGTNRLETGDIHVDGRIFWPKKYIETKVRGDITGQPDDIYISFGLLCEILNSKFCVKSEKGNQLSKIDINDIVVGGHVNMISTDKDLYLIPNKVAPYFNIADLMNDPSLSRDANTAYAEQPMAAVDTTKIKKDVDLTNADAIMKRVLNSAKSRQDLSSIINFESPDGINRNFPQLTDDASNNKAGYYGYLKDVFLNVKTVVEIIVGSKDIKSLFDTICERLSKANPFWRLSVQPSAFDGNITILDENYNNVSQLSTIKGHATVGLNQEDESIYYLDTFNSDSVVTEFKFDVRISDAVASKVINQVNSKMAEGTGGKGFESTENNVDFFTGRTIFTSSFDRILDGEIKFDKPAKSKFGTAGRNEKLYKMVSELDEGCLTIADKNVSLSKKEFDKAVKEIQTAFLAEQKRQLKLNLAAQASEDELRRDQYNRSGILNKSYTGDSLVEKVVLSARLVKDFEDEKISADMAGRILTNPTSDQDRKLLEGVTLVKRKVARLSLPKRHAHLLHRLTADNNDNFVNRNGAPIPQAEIQFSIEGVGGLKSFQILGIKDLPDPYKDKVIFKIKELKHSITNTGWKTNVIAAIIPVKSARNIQ